MASEDYKRQAFKELYEGSSWRGYDAVMANTSALGYSEMVSNINKYADLLEKEAPLGGVNVRPNIELQEVQHMGDTYYVIKGEHSNFLWKDGGGYALGNTPPGSGIGDQGVAISNNADAIRDFFQNTGTKLYTEADKKLAAYFLNRRLPTEGDIFKASVILETGGLLPEEYKAFQDNSNPDSAKAIPLATREKYVQGAMITAKANGETTLSKDVELMIDMATCVQKYENSINYPEAYTFSEVQEIYKEYRALREEWMAIPGPKTVTLYNWDIGDCEWPGEDTASNPYIKEGLYNSKDVVTEDREKFLKLAESKPAGQSFTKQELDAAGIRTYSRKERGGQATTTDTANAALAGGTPSQTSTDKPKPASSTSPAGTNSDTTGSLASPSSSTKATDPKDDDSTSSDSDTDSLASASPAAPSKPASKPMTGSGAGSGSGSSHEEPGSSGAVPNPPLQRSHSANFPAGTDSYEVQRGDTLSGIAAQFGTTVDTLVELNNIHNRNLIHPHQIIRLPGGSADLTNNTALAGTGAGGSGGAYTVVAGDTLSDIAERHGTDYHTLAQMNGIADPHLIRPGQKIRLPEQAGGLGSADDASAAQAPGLVGFSDRQ